MKKIGQIRESYDYITEKEDAESRKLTTLVRAGLFDAKKLPMLKRALSKDVKDMTPAERKILIELLDSLMAEVMQSQQIYSKVKQNVMNEETLEEANKEFDGYYAKYDPRYTKMPSDREIPQLIILKRKAIRIYPDNQKVALYYSQALDKYVSIPFGTFGDGSLNEDKKSDKENEEDPYIIKKTYVKSTPEKTKLRADVDSLRRSIAAGTHGRGAQGQLAQKERYLKKLTKNISTSTKTINLAKQNVSKLSDNNYDTLKDAIKKDRNMDYATKIGTRVGLAAARKWDRDVNIKKPVADSVSKVASIFKKKVDDKRAAASAPATQVTENKLSKFAYDDLDDNTWSSIGKDLTPGLGTERARQRTVNAWKKREYGSAALNALDTAVSGASDLALASGVASGAGAAMKGIQGAAKGAIKTGASMFSKGAKAAKFTDAAVDAIKSIKGAKAATTAAKTADKADDATKAAKVADKGADAAKTAKTADKADDATKTAKVADKADDAADATKTTKVADKADDAAKSTKAADKVDDAATAAKTADKVDDAADATKTAKAADKVDDAVDVAKQSKKSSVPTAGTRPKNSRQSFREKLARGARRAAGAAGAGAAALGALAGASGTAPEKKYVTPGEFTLKAKVNDPSAERQTVRTSVQAKDDANLRKSLKMQNESVLDQLYSANNDEETTLYILDESVVINKNMANKILNVYESVNDINKQKIEAMLNENVDSFKKFLNFAVRQ